MVFRFCEHLQELRNVILEVLLLNSEIEIRVSYLPFEFWCAPSARSNIWHRAAEPKALVEDLNPSLLSVLAVSKPNYNRELHKYKKPMRHWPSSDATRRIDSLAPYSRAGKEVLPPLPAALIPLVLWAKHLGPMALFVLQRFCKQHLRLLRRRHPQVSQGQYSSLDNLSDRFYCPHSEANEYSSDTIKRNLYDALAAFCDKLKVQILLYFPEI
ncbi:hypothetical protein CLF_113197 [Clonorchis sinensis]|uniref:Uncharacterized protein n=1 Tax=Clonorchis sinensis TaxID=79923 RepID=G7YXV8_CLOSI|nr:hypothetical protein CLF_113197 [Clonorchis sinensis]